jgi:hypothetical protein
MSTLEEFNKAVEAGLYNKFTRYGKMTVHFYHNEQLKLYFVLHLQDSSQDFSYELIYMQYV